MRHMDSFSAIAIVVIIVIVAAVAYFAHKNGQKMIKSGKVIKRDGDFLREEHTFTTAATYSEFVNEFKMHNVSSDGITYNTERGITTFKGNTSWEAEFYKIKTAPDELNKYVFNITKWRSHKGMPYGLQEMNILLTAIEKTFLAIDPSTKVTRVKQETQSKSKFL